MRDGCCHGLGHDALRGATSCGRICLAMRATAWVHWMRAAVIVTVILLVIAAGALLVLMRGR